jgi:type 1 fimbriae regulatory protein FimB/type 1 fimbriae regulatory protein FimE
VPRSGLWRLDSTIRWSKFRGARHGSSPRLQSSCGIAGGGLKSIGAPLSPDAYRVRAHRNRSLCLSAYSQRDATLILVAYRHGLRAIEVADLEWSQVEWGRSPALHVRRKKNGKPAVHPIRGDELRMLRELQRNTEGAFVFQTERGGPFTADAVNRLVKRIGERAGFPFQVHAHMLRHACGYAMANAGHDTRGHRAIQHTARYTELSPIRFKDAAQTAVA